MPWTPEDALRHTEKANTRRRQEMWAEVANDALKRALKEGKSREEAEAAAIKQANAVVRRDVIKYKKRR